MNTIKQPDTTHAIAPFIAKRWSARSFTDQAIAPETMEQLLEAASWSASSMNEQPWHYLYAFRGSQAFKRMTEVLMDGNKPWAKDAAVLMIALAKRHFDRNGKENRHYMHDVGAANTTLLLQAADVGILGHMMGGFHMDEALKAFAIDDSKWEIACFIALGYPGDPDALEEPYAEREKTPRSRKALTEFTQQLND